MAEGTRTRKRSREVSAPVRLYDEFQVKPKLGRGDFSEEEDTQLYAGLLKFGPIDLENLCKIVPTRNEHQIKQRITTLQKKAQSSLTTVFKKQNNGIVKQLPRDKVALDKWLEQVEKMHQQEQIEHGSKEELPVRMLARAVGFISKYEEHPEPELCGGVNLRNVYEFLENMLMGLPSRRLSGPDSNFLLEGLQRLSSNMESMGVGRETAFLMCGRPDWKHRNKQSRTYGHKKQKKEEKDTHAEFLAADQHNPFHVPAEWLKKSFKFS